MQVGDDYHGNLDVGRLDRLLDALRAAGGAGERRARPREPTRMYEQVILRNVRVPDGHTMTIYQSTGGYRALAKTLRDYRPEQVIDLVKEFRLRGRGGAGFPTGLKWSFVPKQSEKPKYLCVNADEGEPGTFKDRIIMERDPHQLIEGMAITAYAIGAHVAYVYIRGEYVLAIRTLEAAIAEARENGYLGRDILGSGFDFDMHIHCGAGAYICGEETAMLELARRQAGAAATQAALPAVAGLYASPTVINNVETLACVPHSCSAAPPGSPASARKRAPAPSSTASAATSGNPGSTSCPWASRCASSLRSMRAARPRPQIQPATPGGVSAPLIPESGLDVGMDFDLLAAGSMLGSAGVIEQYVVLGIPLRQLYVLLSASASTRRSRSRRVGRGG